MVYFCVNHFALAKKPITTKTNKWSSIIMRFHCFNCDWVFNVPRFSLAISLHLGVSLSVCVLVSASLSIFHFNPVTIFKYFNVFLSQLKIFFRCCCYCDGGGCTDQNDDTLDDMISIKLNDVDDFFIYCSAVARRFRVLHKAFALHKHRFLLVEWMNSFLFQ